MPLETDEGMNTVLLSQRSGRHWNWCNSQTPIIWSMLVPGWAQPSLGAARDTIPGAVGELGMCSGAHLRQRPVPPALQPPQLCGTAPRDSGSDPQPRVRCCRGSRELQVHRKHGKPRGACSPGKHTQPGGRTNRPRRRVLSSERVLGNSFTKCHWSLEPNLMYRIYYSKQLVLAPLCTTCRRTPASRLFTTDSFPFHMKENKNIS